MASLLIPENPMGRNVLAAIRALGRKGHSIYVAHPGRNTKNKRLCVEKLLRSRYVKKINYIPDPLITPDDFIAHIIRLVKKRDYDLLMPFTSRTFPLISLHSKELKKYTKLICSDFETYSKANDKERITSIAAKLGLPVPNSICPATINDLKKLISLLDFPVVVKARVNSGMQKGLRYAHDRDELISAYSEISQQQSIKGLIEFNRPVVQEFIPGKIYDALYYYNNGELVAFFTQCREVTNPLSGGPGAQNVTIKDKRLFDYGKTLLDSLCWHGPAMVEVKLDPRDNKYKLLEINPKFWGTLDLSIKCGVNFPEIALNLALYGKLHNEVNQNFNEGLRYRWLVLFIKAHRADRVSRIGSIRKLFNKVDFNDIDYRDCAPTLYNFLLFGINIIKDTKSLRKIDESAFLY